MPDTENASASSEKRFTRLPGSPISPVTCCSATWNIVNESPASAADAKSAGKPGASAGSEIDAARPADPASIGVPAPTRSE